MPLFGVTHEMHETVLLCNLYLRMFSSAQSSRLQRVQHSDQHAGHLDRLGSTL